MGTFAGHALPGVLFIILSIWWMVQFTYKQIALGGGRLKPKGRVYRVMHSLPVEGVVVLVAGMVGFIAEMMFPVPKWTFLAADGQFKHPAEWQHCTMYTYFSIYGLVVTLSMTCLPKAKRYTALFCSMAFFIEGMLFYYHTHGRSDLDVHLHSLLVIAIGTCCTAAAGEIWFPKDDRIRIIRYTATALQGTWFIQVGTVLYWPLSGTPWNEEDHLNLMLITVSFAWHLLVDVLLMVAVYGVASLIFKATGAVPVCYQPMKTNTEEIEFDERNALLNGGGPACVDSDADVE